jgi:hypothetical protein
MSLEHYIVASGRRSMVVVLVVMWRSRLYLVKAFGTSGTACSDSMKFTLSVAVMLKLPTLHTGDTLSTGCKISILPLLNVIVGY